MSRTPASRCWSTISDSNFWRPPEESTCKSRTKARRSPWFPLTNASMASFVYSIDSWRRTRRAMRRSASSDTLSNVMVFKWRLNLSFVLRHVDDERPQRPMTSLQARITGCFVDSRSLNNSAFPPESPESDTDSSSSIPFLIRSSLTARSPPPMWSTSSNKMSVRWWGLVGSWKRERCVEDCVAALRMATALRVSPDTGRTDQENSFLFRLTIDPTIQPFSDFASLGVVAFKLMFGGWSVPFCPIWSTAHRFRYSRRFLKMFFSQKNGKSSIERRVCVASSRFRTVTVRSSKDWWSIVTHIGMPTTSARA